MSKNKIPSDFAFEKSGRYYRTQGNYNNAELFGNEYESNNLPSITVPDQALSVQDLIERHRKGLGITGYRSPVYYDEVVVPPIENMDFAEKRAFLDHIKEHRATIEQIFAQNEDENLKAQKEAEFQALVDAEILKRSQTDG
jgi:hypothetical protein